jgi:hypothetical protein
LVACLVVVLGGSALPKDARAAIGFVQSSASVSGATGTSKSATFLNPITTGDLITVGCSVDTAASSITVSDTYGNTYTPIGSLKIQGTEQAQLFYAKNIIGGASDSVTCTYDVSAINRDIFVHEYAGADRNNPLDVSAYGSGASGTALDSGAATTNSASEVLFAFGFCTTCIAPGTNFTQRVLDGGDMSEDRITTSVGSYNATMTQSSSGAWLLLMAAFKPASGIQVSSRSDTLSDSRPSATSNHTFAFTVNNAIYGSSNSGSSTLALTLDPNFTISAGMNCGDVDAATSIQFGFNYPACLATATAWGFSATGSVITLIPPTNTGELVASGTPITIKIGSNATVGQQGANWITNPSTAGIYTISVGGTFGGSGNMLVSINSGVTVQTTVAESLAFTVSSVKAVNCTADDGATVSAVDTSPTSVPLGTLFPVNTFFTGCQDLVVSTNAGGGYSLTVQEQTLMHTPGGFTFPQTACDGAACTLTTAAAWTNPANNGFGHTCFNQDGNHDCASTYSSGTKFRPTANVAAGDAAQTVMASSTPASVTARIKYRISAGIQQAAGTYTTVIVYTITPTY